MKNMTGCACSCIGYSHLREGKECQDSSMYISGNKYMAIMVSDGHGGQKHFRSAAGSQIAKEICMRIIPEYVNATYGYKNFKQIEKALKDFEKHLIYCWRDEIENELIINPLTEEEFNILTDESIREIEKHPHIAFGATLLLAIACKDYLQIIQLGDGDCRIRTRDSIEKPIPEDKMLHFGRTTSLCNEDAFGKIRDIILPLGAVEACFLSSDGVFNSFDTEENFCKFVETVADEINEPGCDLGTELETFLPKLSEKGSGDDVSVAVMAKKH